jgi:hypothetical protein
MAGKSSWDQANRPQKLGLVWRIRKKISQIIKDYFYLPFFLLIILCSPPFPPSRPGFCHLSQVEKLTVFFSFQTLRTVCSQETKEIGIQKSYMSLKEGIP